MTSKSDLIVIGLLLVATIFIVQSAPVEPLKETTAKADNALRKSDELEKSSITTSNSPILISSVSKTLSTLKHETIIDIKKKRNINSYDQIEGLIDDKSDESDDNDDDDDDDDDYNDEQKVNHKLLTNFKEISSQSHDSTHNSVDTDNSDVFTDIKMNPDELTNVERKRRYISLEPKPNQRRKRALTAYDFYEDDPLFQPLTERRPFIRPSRAFAPLYWYPSAYERNIRANLVPSLYDSPEWTKVYPNTIETDDDDDEEDLIPLPINEDDDEGENEYDYMLYPILLDAPINPYDNLQAQQQYNVDALPIDEDDQYEQRLIATYGPMAYYLK